MSRVQTGLDRIAAGDPDALALVSGRRVGLLAHPASVTSALEHARDVLVRAGADVQALFGPEHGYGGEAQDMIGVSSDRDVITGARVYSLYGSTYESLSPQREWLEGLDVVVVDLQDIGSRYYTFVWTALLMARACSAAGVETLILDRPNPLGGVLTEGAPQDEALCSFVGLVSVPVRHGLTIGEMVLWRAREEALQGVRVLSMHGWKRSMVFEDTGLVWVLPSPNMPTQDTARVYPGGCLLEGTNVSEGRGCTRPFEVFGAPWVRGDAIREALSAQPGVRARPIVFEPTFHKHAKKLCGGVQLHVTDRNVFRPYATYLAVLGVLRRSPEFEWRTDAYEFVREHPAVDLLTGDARVREALDAGERDPEALVAIGSERMEPWIDPRGRWLYHDLGA